MDRIGFSAKAIVRDADSLDAKATYCGSNLGVEVREKAVTAKPRDRRRPAVGDEVGDRTGGDEVVGEATYAFVIPGYMGRDVGWTNVVDDG